VYHNSGEINFTLDRKQEAMEALKDHFSKQEKVLQLLDFDGYRLEFHDWWFNVRPSNTEPYLRLIVEAKVAPLLDLKIKEITEIINKFK
jgi:phosphomannomutase